MSDTSERLGGAGILELTGKIMVVAIVLLLFIVVFVFCLHLYAKHFWYRRRENPNPDAATRRHPLDPASGHQEIAVARRGLEPSLLKTLPILIFDPKEFKDGLECAVCLSDISQGEKTRLLPKCNHGFHLACIDMWFESHSTCPLCRNSVRNQNSGDELPQDAAIETTPVDVSPAEAQNFPTNVLIWGDETQVSTFTPSVEENNRNQANNAVIVIIEPSSSGSSMSSTSSTPDGIISAVDIHPRQISEDDEQKSAMPTRLRSLKRLLSYNNRRVNPSSSRNLDLEQGGGRGQN